MLKSYLYDYIDLFLNDGCTEISVCDFLKNEEIGLDDHKLLLIYSRDEERIASFEKTLIQEDVYPNDDIKLIIDGGHIHSGSKQYKEKFHEFCYAIGAHNSDDNSEDSTSLEV